WFACEAQRLNGLAASVPARLGVAAWAGGGLRLTRPLPMDGLRPADPIQAPLGLMCRATAVSDNNAAMARGLGSPDESAAHRLAVAPVLPGPQRHRDGRAEATRPTRP